MGNFVSNYTIHPGSKPKIIVVPNVYALREKYSTEGGKPILVHTQTTRLTSSNFHKILAEAHLDISMFFENAEKRTFTINPSPGTQGIVFNNFMDRKKYKLVLYRDAESTDKQVTRKGSSDSWSIATLVDGSDDDMKGDAEKTPELDMEHHYDPQTDTLFIDHRYTCVVNANDRSRKWLMNGLEDPNLRGTVPEEKFKKFGSVYPCGSSGSKKIENERYETDVYEEDRDVGCLPIFL